MSDTPDERMTGLSKKKGICNKNVKAMMEMIKTLTEQIDKPIEKHLKRGRRLTRFLRKNR